MKINTVHAAIVVLNASPEILRSASVTVSNYLQKPKLSYMHNTQIACAEIV
jgi:hypothetical protein